MASQREPHPDLGEGKYDAVVLGAGVLGLSIANDLVDRGYRIAIVAKDLPEDLDSTGFASPWAGANIFPFAVNEAERRRDEITFHRFAQLAKDAPELCERRWYRYYWSTEGAWKEPWCKDMYFNYRLLEPSEVPGPWTYGVTYESYTVNPPGYLAHLSQSLASKGVPILRSRLSALDEAYSLSEIGKVDLVVNATGLGARSLLGVEDPLVYPAKGQTVLVRAPEVKVAYGISEPHPTQGRRRYVIPRPGAQGQGHVILGGCMLPHDWSTNVDMAMAESVLKEAFAIEPLLAGPGPEPEPGPGPGKARRETSWKDIQVLKHNVGLRPMREGGMRLELEQRVVGQPSPWRQSQSQSQLRGKEGSESLLPTSVKEDLGRQVAVVHAYGVGPAGYQGSLGIAEEVAGLVDSWFKGRK